MIKIEIHILDGCLDIEIKNNNEHYSLIVIISKSETYKEKGRAWSDIIDNKEKISEIVNLIKESHENPSIPTAFTINDGRSVTVSLKEDAKDLNLNLVHCYAEEHNEYQLVNNILHLINETIQDKILDGYTLLFNEF
ncbi:hypothetical protein [Chryseobacterium sp. Mn2064]|uniref:hypothetical protein n=1 Tax=Chryseobacterium sp. Mn2064 TaxID=3395263 RepID=UPI003BE202B0